MERLAGANPVALLQALQADGVDPVRERSPLGQPVVVVVLRDAAGRNETLTDVCAAECDLIKDPQELAVEFRVLEVVQWSRTRTRCI